MPKNTVQPKFINIATDTLEIGLSDKRSKDLSISTETMSSPIWELVYFNFMYSTVHAEDKKKGHPVASYFLAHPPLWLVAMGTIMWQGILQGATWDVVKAALEKALDKLRAKKLAPSAEISLETGWTKYSSSGKKQYEMFLSFKRTYKELPDKHAEAYAHAKDRKQFGQIIRGEIEVPDPAAVKPNKRVAEAVKKTVRKIEERSKRA